MRRAGTCDSIASRPARRFADDDRSDLVVVTCFCLVSECVSGVSECVSGGGPGDACPRRGWAQTSAGGRVRAVSESCGGVGTSANPTHLGVWRLFFVPLHLREEGAAGAAAEAAPQDQGRARRAGAFGVRTRPARQDQAEQQVPRVGRALVPALTQRLAETSTLGRWLRPDHDAAVTPSSRSSERRRVS